MQKIKDLFFNSVAIAAFIGMIFIIVIEGFFPSIANAQMLGTPGPEYSQPGWGSGTFGNCNKDGEFCWSITIEGPTPPYHYYPISVEGEQAQIIVQRGRIIDRRFAWDGWNYLVQTGWEHWFYYKNKTFECWVTHRAPQHYYCEEWKPR